MNPQFRSMLMAMHALEPKEKPVPKPNLPVAELTDAVLDEYANEMAEYYYPTEFVVSRDRFRVAIKLAATDGHLSGLLLAKQVASGKPVFPVGGTRQPVYDFLKKLGFTQSGWSDKVWSRDGEELWLFGAGSMARFKGQEFPLAELPDHL